MAGTLGILSSGLLGEVVSPAKIVYPLANGSLSEGAWGTAKALTAASSGALSETTSSSFTDNFASFTSANNWTMTLKGSAGTYAFNAGNAQLNPVFQQISNVSMRHGGTFKSVAATVSMAPLYFNANTDYLTISLGTGALINNLGDGTSWWFTSLANGYHFQVHNSGALALFKMANGVSTQLATVTPSGFNYAAANVFELDLSPTGVVAKLNGTAIMSSTDTTFVAGGDILIAQGSYTTGNGAQATITKVTAQ